LFLSLEVDLFAAIVAPARALHSPHCAVLWWSRRDGRSRLRRRFRRQILPAAGGLRRHDKHRRRQGIALAIRLKQCTA